jgi:hypothetical protein
MKVNIQKNFINELLKNGQIQLTLPNDIVLEVGITQENKYGDLEKNPNYCWVIASQNGRTVLLDKYNLGLRYKDDEDEKIIFEDKYNYNGEITKVLDVI